MLGQTQAQWQTHEEHVVCVVSMSMHACMFRLRGLTILKALIESHESVHHSLNLGVRQLTSIYTVLHNHSQRVSALLLVAVRFIFSMIHLHLFAAC